MKENKEKKVENLKDTELLTNEFNKTIYGKLMISAMIVFGVFAVIGLSIGVFEAIVNFRNLDINKYQLIIDFGKLCRDCGGDVVFYAAIFYTCILPVLIKDESEYKKNNKYIATLCLVIFAIIVLGYTLNFITDVAPIVEKIMGM